MLCRFGRLPSWVVMAVGEMFRLACGSGRLGMSRLLRWAGVCCGVCGRRLPSWLTCGVALVVLLVGGLVCARHRKP